MDVKVLGPLEVTVGDAQLTVTSPTQGRILAALVARKGATVASDRLADMVGVSLRALRTAVSRLRALVGDDLIVTRANGYTLGDVEVDVERFEDLLERARLSEPGAAVSAIDSALLLWRGDPYGEFSDTGWAGPVASRLDERRASAIEDRGEALLALGRSSEVVVAMAAHAAEFPLRDRPVELLMRALAAEGRQAEALRRFREYRRRLVDEAGLEPGGQLIEVDARIAAGRSDAPIDPAGPSRRPSSHPVGNVRAPLTSFVGRDRAVIDVNRAIGEHRLVTLIGAGGVGKTRLAIESILRSREWPDGAWLVELGSVESGGDVADAVARTLAIRRVPGLGSVESVVRWCEQRTMLLILDNCEHILDSCARLVDALSGRARAVTVLATSREPLMVAGEHVVPVDPLPLADDGFAHGGAAELFIARARAELPTFDPERHRDAIANICRRLDGLPLALELAATRVRGMPVERIASRLDERFGLLTGGRRLASERHATLRAAVDWSYGLLSDRERQVFDSVSIFAGPFTLDDAVTLADDEVDELDAIDAVTHLVDCSLVARSETSPDYRLLETLRAYGRERLAAAERTHLIGDRHAVLMARKAMLARAAAAGPDENRVVTTLRAQVADFAAAVNWAAEHGSMETAVRIAEDFFIPLSLWGDNSEPGLWMRDLVDSEFSDDAAMAANRWITGHWYMFFGDDLDRSIALAEEAVALDPSSAWANVMVTFGAVMSGREDDARKAAAAAHGLARDDGERPGVFIATGTALSRTGDVDGASRVADDFVAWAERRRIPSATDMALLLRGQFLAEQRPVDALRTLERALALVRDQVPGCWNVETLILRDMMPLVRRTRPDDAPALALTALRSCVRHNETGNIAGVFAHVATLLAEEGHDEPAAYAVGAAGATLLAPNVAATFEITERVLRESLGTRYDELVADGSRTPAMSTARAIIDLLDPSG